MSFWDTIGSLAKTGSPLLGVFDAARVASQVEDPNDGPDGTAENVKQFGAAFFKSTVQGPSRLALQGLTSNPVQKALYPVVWTGNQVDHGLAALGTGIDAEQAQGRSGWGILWDDKSWDDAWARTENTTFGELFTETVTHSEYDAADRAALTGLNFAPDSDRIRAEFEENRDKTGFRVAAGAMDILATWYADPTIVLGKAAQAARAGSKIIDAAQADEVAGAIGQASERGLAEKAAGTFSTAPEETASRLYAQVAKTDNMSVTDAAAHFKPMLERSGDAAPIIGLLGQAGRISDVAVQRAVKADTILAAAGSKVARDRLMQAAPDIARALQRSTLPPEQFAIVDNMVAQGLSGKALLDATKAWSTKGNKAELKAYAKDLDAIHDRLGKIAEVGSKGGVENVGGSVLGAVKQKYRSGMAHEFFYNPGPHGRTVRVVHWATGQRMKGVIDVSDAVRGHDELMDTMVRSGLFTGAERQRLATKWWSAPTKEARAGIAHAYPTFMLAKLAEKHGLTKSEMKDVLKQYGDWSQAARTYTSKALEEARLNNLSRVTLEDPATGIPVSIDKLLFEKHVADSAAVPDVAALERLIRARKGSASAADKVKDKLSPAWNSLEDINDIWRTLTLARPGFIARTQFDTQARSMVTIGATNIVADAMRGLGHKVTDKLTGQQVQEVVDQAETLARRESLTAQAADLRQQAARVPNDAGAKMLARADELEKQAAQDVTKTITGRRLATDEREVDLGNGVKVKERAVGSDAERQMLAPALHTGPQSITDAILRVSGKLQGELVEDANKWVTTMPDSDKWSAAWLRSKDALVASPAGRKILEVLDLPNVDMMKALRSSPEVRAAHREVRTGNPHFESWLDRAIAQAEWTAPTTEIRQALLSGKVLDETDVERMFAPHVDTATRKATEVKAAAGEAHLASLKAQLIKADDRVAALEQKVERARTAETQIRHEEALEAAQQKVEDLKARLDELAPAKAEDDADFVYLWHTTTPENAQALTSQGTTGAKPVGKNTTGTDYEPGRGMGKGIYLSKRPDPTFGSVAIPVKVRKDELAVPPERAHRIKAGMTPEKSLNVGDGYTETVLDPSRFGSSAPVTFDNLSDFELNPSKRFVKPEPVAAPVDTTMPDRMPVHAPAMDVINPLKERLNLMDQTRKFVRWMSDQPDTVLGRVPFYTERYFKHFEELGRREVARNGELGAEARLAIEKVARHRAIQDTRQTMYDTARFTGAHDRSARMMFAFLGAWEDSMRAWGRMFYDDPSRIGKLTKTWYAPDRGGFIVDESGNRVTPGDDSREKWIVLPISIPGTQVTEFKLRKDSFNSMFQGEVPWAPGFGPMVQVPVTQLAARTFPEVADPNYTVKGVKVGENVLLRQMFGFGLPKVGVTAGDQAGSVVDQLTPGWMRRLTNIVNGGSQQFADAYAMGLNAALIEAREQGKDVNSKAVQEWADKRARDTARSATMLEFISNYGLGLSGEGATKAEFYRERYREISANTDALKARGTTVQEEFLRQHPEAAGLKWSFSENQTGINATLQVENRSRKFERDIQKNPEFGWFYVGSDNIGGEFSPAIYSSQFNREGSPGSGEAWRSRQNPAEIRKATSSSLGWDAWNAVSEKVNLVLQQRGLTSVNQKGAEDLKQIKADFKANLAAENPDWFKDYSDFDSSKMTSFIDQVAKPSLKDGRLKNRPDIKAMGDYLELRQKAMDIANQNGYSLGSNKAAELRQILNDAGAQMAADNLGFSQMWTRVLSREVDE